MYIVVGLGNPGKQYEGTRHNVGFDVIDVLADKYNISVIEKKHKALIGKGVIAGHKAILVKPMTFMNASGESIREVLDYYKADEEEELIVIYDDISLVPGGLRIRGKGSAGGHNGIKSVLQHLGHDMFKRIKVGVGEKPKGWDLVDHVLGHFTTEERKKVDEAIQTAAEAVAILISDGLDEAMNKCNRSGK